MRIVVTGASGLIGRALLRALLSAGHETTVLVRRAAGPGEARWDPAAATIEPAALEGAGAVVLGGPGEGRHRLPPQGRQW